jgi:hypothetical protein
MATFSNLTLVGQQAKIEGAIQSPKENTNE